MDFTGPTDFIVAGMPGQTWAGPAGHFVAGPPGEVMIGEPSHVPIHIDPVVRPPAHDTSAPIPQPTATPPQHGPWTPPQVTAQGPLETPTIGAAIGAANRAESAAALVTSAGGVVAGGGASAAAGSSGGVTGTGDGGATSGGGVSWSGAAGGGGGGAALGASPAATQAGSFSRMDASAPGASPAAVQAATDSAISPTPATGTTVLQVGGGGGGGAPMTVNQPTYNVSSATDQAVEVFPSYAVSQGAMYNSNHPVLELSNFDHDTANVLAPMNTSIRQGNVSVRFGSPFVHKHTGPTSVSVQGGPKNFVVYDSQLNTNFGLNKYSFSFDQSLLLRDNFQDIHTSVDFSDLELDPMDFSDSHARIDPEAFRQVKVELDDLKVDLNKDLFKRVTTDLEDVTKRIEFGPYSPAEVDFSDVERPLIDFSDQDVERVDEAQPRTSLIQVQIDGAGRTDVDFGFPSIPEDGSGRVVSYLS